MGTYGRRHLALGVGLLLSVAVWQVSTKLFAQDDTVMAPSKVERKNRAPVSRQILPIRLPKPFEAKLKNGLTVLILEDHRAPFITLQLHLNGAGALYEPAALAGLASTTADMLNEGTRTRSSLDLAEEIERLGASIGAAASFGAPDAVFSASGLSENFDSWFKLAVEMLLQPSFPADELDKMKQRMRAQLRQQRSRANFLLTERFSQLVYGDHPASRVSATAQSIDRLSRDSLIDWHRQRFTPEHSILGIAGDVKAKKLVAKLERDLAGWKRRQVEVSWPPDPAPATARKVLLVHRPNSVQTTVALGNIAIDRRHADYLPMVLMNDIIGGGPSARLFLNLREEKGYTYGVYSSFSALRYPGPWRAGGNMRTEVTAAALAEFFNEINRIRDEKVSDRELEESKRSIVASFALSLEQPTRTLNFTITQRLYGLPRDYWDTYAAKLMAVRAEDVQRVARKYLNPESLQLVAVGDAMKIKNALEKYGAVEVYNSEGASISGKE